MSRKNMSCRNPLLTGLLCECQALYAHVVTTQLELNGMPHSLLLVDLLLGQIKTTRHIFANLDLDLHLQNS